MQSRVDPNQWEPMNNGRNNSGNVRQPISNRQRTDPDFDRGPVPSDGRLFDSTFGASSHKTSPAVGAAVGGGGGGGGGGEGGSQHSLTSASLAKITKESNKLTNNGGLVTGSTRYMANSGSSSTSPAVTRIPPTSNSGAMTSDSDMDFHLPSMEKLLVEIQNAYFDISRLEEKCTLSFKQAELKYGTAFNLDMYSDLYQTQVKLMNKYFDFMFLAYHPSGDSVIRGLVKRYKIPLRMWNKGIFKFLDILRSRLPDSKELITKFIFHCFHLLSMLVEPPYESRHMWLEALGDISRFSMAVGNISNCDWRVISQYWYLRATNKSPGVGRLYHHCAVVCIYRLDSLYYFCKSLTVLQPFAPSREIILSLFDSNKGEFNTPIASFITLHEINITQADFRKFELPELLSQVALGVQKDDEFCSRGALLAICNISAIMGYGGANDPYVKYFTSQMYEYDKDALRGDSNSSKGSSGGDMTNFRIVTTAPTASTVTTTTTTTSQDSKTFGYFYISKQICFEILRTYLAVSWIDSLPHVIIWLHFLKEINDNRDLTDRLVQDPMFPAQELVDFLNVALQETLNIIYGDNPSSSVAEQGLEERITNWMSEQDHERPHSMDGIAYLNIRYNEQNNLHRYPFLRQRPLPEELLLYGLIWARKFGSDPLVVSYELPTNDDLYPGYSKDQAYTSIRIVKAVRLAIDLVKSSSWITHNISGFLLEPKFKLHDMVYESETSGGSPF